MTIRSDREISRTPSSTARSVLAIALALGAGFSLACVAGTSLDDEDNDREIEAEEDDRAAGEENGEDSVIDALVLDFAAREATARDAIAECVGVEPARAELDGWIGSGLRDGALRDAICGELPSPDPREQIDRAFLECLGDPADEVETQAWLDLDLRAEDTYAAICDSEESLRRLIEAAYLRWIERAATLDEVEGWLDTGLLRAELLRELAQSSDARKVRMIRDAYLTCHGFDATSEQILPWFDEPVSDADVLTAICGPESAHPLVVEVELRDCYGYEPSEADIEEWVHRTTPGSNVGEQICKPDEAADRRSIASSFKTCIGRDPTAAEVAVWLKTGKSGAELEAAICDTPAARRHTIAKAFLACIGREAHADEIAAWDGSTHTTKKLRYEICHSAGARRHAIRLAHQQCLGRKATDDEVNAWEASKLSGGEIRWMICNSEEARKHPVVIVSHFEKRPADWFYDIFRNNCHTAANKGVLESPLDTGIVACRPGQTGMGVRGKGVGGHTFNYRLANGNTSYWNWGPPPCECPGTPPADYSQQGCHRTCVEKMCGGQFDATTKALPVGQLVEVPGPSICAGQTFAEDGDVEDCNACCDARADTDWAGGTPDPIDAIRDSYRKDCKAFCTSFFREDQ